MKFGVREICNVVFKAKASQKIGNMTFKAGQPVLYIDTATTSTLESEATTVYAQGGRGNVRLIAWEGEKTLTFTVEDALLSPIGFAVLSGAGLIHNDGNKTAINSENGHDDSSHAKQHFHMNTSALVDTDGVIDLTDALGKTESICEDAPIFAVVTEADGSVTNEVISGLAVTAADDATVKQTLTGATAYAGKTVFVDYYVTKDTKNVYELQIDAENFAGYYYVEADTLFRDQNSGKDLPANITLPNVKIQSNFTFDMAATGDPSTFSFTMDAFPGYTMFDKTRKVLCVIQIVNETDAESSADPHTLMPSEQDHAKFNYMDEETGDTDYTGIKDSVKTAAAADDEDEEAAKSGT